MTFDTACREALLQNEVNVLLIDKIDTCAGPTLVTGDTPLFNWEMLWAKVCSFFSKRNLISSKIIQTSYRISCFCQSWTRTLL